MIIHTTLTLGLILVRRRHLGLALAPRLIRCSRAPFVPLPATPPNPKPSTATVHKLFASERSPLTLFSTFETIFFSTTRTGFGKLLHD